VALIIMTLALTKLTVPSATCQPYDPAERQQCPRRAIIWPATPVATGYEKRVLKEHMPRGSHGKNIVDMIRRRAFRIALTLLPIALMPFALKQYVVQECLVVLIAIFVVLVPVLLVLVAFVLLQDGVRRAVRGLNTSLSRLTVWSRLHFRASRLRTRF
jgi:hypothetical protein